MDLLTLELLDILMESMTSVVLGMHVPFELIQILQVAGLHYGFFNSCLILYASFVCAAG